MQSSRLLRLYRQQPRILQRLYSIVPVPASEATQINQNEARPYKDIPGPRGIYNIPKFGGALLFSPFTKVTLENFHELLDDLHKKYGPIFRISIGSGLVFVTDPKDIETVYQNEGKYPARPKLEIFNIYLERTKKEKKLGVLNGEKWAELRQQIQKKLVRPKSALHYIDSQAEVAQDLVHKLKNVKSGDVRELLFLYATESISLICFNKRLGLLGDSVDDEALKYLDNSKTFFTLINAGTIGFPFYKFFETPTYKKFKEAADNAYGYGKEQIEEALEKTLEMKRDGTWNVNEPNFLMSLLSESKLSIDQITGIALDLMIGGTDSTAKSLEIFLDCLARNPDVQEKLYEEILEHMGKDGDLTSENFPKMKYLTACMKESFRMYYPLATGSSRFLPVDVVLSGYHIPAGTLVGMNNRALLLSSDYVSEPTKFKPERWLRNEKGEKGDNIPSVGLIPFSLGVRNCIGRRFAEQEIYLAVAKVIQNYKVKVDDETSDRTMIYQTFGSFAEKSMFTFVERK